jgi:hypothetical protein
VLFPRVCTLGIVFDIVAFDPFVECMFGLCGCWVVLSLVLSLELSLMCMLLWLLSSVLIVV